VAYAFKTFGLVALTSQCPLLVRATKSKIFVSLCILLFFKILAVVPYFNNPYVVFARLIQIFDLVALKKQYAPFVCA